jgi:hypothetical protein
MEKLKKIILDETPLIFDKWSVYIDVESFEKIENGCKQCKIKYYDILFNANVKGPNNTITYAEGRFAGFYDNCICESHVEDDTSSENDTSSKEEEESEDEIYEVECTIRPGHSRKLESENMLYDFSHHNNLVWPYLPPSSTKEYYYNEDEIIDDGFFKLAYILNNELGGKISGFLKR